MNEDPHVHPHDTNGPCACHLGQKELRFMGLQHTGATVVMRHHAAVTDLGVKLKD